MPLKELQATWCLVASDGTKMRGESRGSSWAGTCALPKAAQQLENKAQCPCLGARVLILMSKADPCLLGGQHSIDARGHCSLRTRLQTRLCGYRLVGIETDLWALWYQVFGDKWCFLEMFEFDTEKEITSATSLRNLPGPFIAWLPLYSVWLPNICCVLEITQYC